MSIHEILQQGVEGGGCQEEGCDEEEYEGDGFDDERDHDSVVSDRRYGGDLEKLGTRKIIIWVVLR